MKKKSEEDISAAILYFICGIVLIIVYFFCININKNADEIIKPILSMVIIFWGVSLYTLFKIRSKSLINKNGENCYGKIYDVAETGCFIGFDEGGYYQKINVELYIFIPSKSEFEKILLRYNPLKFKYQIGDYVKCKHYAGNFIIKEAVDINQIPSEIRYGLKEYDLPNDINVRGVIYVKNRNGEE